MSIALTNRRPTSRYRPPLRVPPPLPPRWASAEAEMARSPFSQFIFLSMLLHALFIALFGAPSGGSREGRAVWGDLNVVIAGKAREEMREEIRPRASVAPVTPGVASAPAPVVPNAPPASVIPETVPAASVPDPIRMHEVVPRLLDRLPTTERSIDTPLLVPPPTEIQVFPLPPPPAPPPVTREVAAPPIESARPMVAVPPTLLEAPPLARPAPPPIAAPLVQPLPQAAIPPPPERALADTPQIAPAPPVPVARPAESTPVEVQAVPALPVAPPAIAVPARVEPIARPVDRALMEELPAVPPRPPTALERALMGPPEIVRAAPEMPAEIGPRTIVPGGTSGATTAPGITGTPRFGPAPGEFPRGREGPGNDYDPTAPSLDAEAMRRRAAQLGREGTGNRALLPFAMPPAAPPKSRIETALEKARKPDCRDAYKHLGLAAIVPLLANEFGEGSCRW